MRAPQGTEMAPRPTESPHSLPSSRMILKASPPYEDDEDLAANHDEIDAYEEPVLCDILEDVELVVKTAVAEKFKLEICTINRVTLDLLDLVEDLKPHKSVEYKSIQPLLAVLHIVVAEEVHAAEV